MDLQAAAQADAIVRSFSYVARQLAGHAAVTPVQYKQIRSEAEKHGSALNLLRRDLVAHAAGALRAGSIGLAEYHSACRVAGQLVAKAKREITRTLDELADYALAA